MARTSPTNLNQPMDRDMAARNSGWRYLRDGCPLPGCDALGRHMCRFSVSLAPEPGVDQTHLASRVLGQQLKAALHRPGVVGRLERAARKQAQQQARSCGRDARAAALAVE